MRELRSGVRTYLPTEDDALWLLRAVEAEGEPRVRVAATLVNGFMWARSKARFAGSLADWVRSYAQPVNPRHYLDGDLFRKTWGAASPDKRVQLERVAQAREKHHSTRTAFSDATRAAVERALTRATANDVTDYAAPWVDASAKGYVARPPVVPGQNRFWTRPAAIGWAGYGVALGDGGSGAGPIVACCLAVVWFVLKSKA